MKKLIYFVLLFLVYNQNIIAQNKKIANDYATLTNALIIIKSQTEDIGREIKTDWAPLNVKIQSDRSAGKAETSKKEKDTLNTLRDTSKSDTSKKVQDTLKTIKPKSKPITDTIKVSDSTVLKTHSTKIDSSNDVKETGISSDDIIKMRKRDSIFIISKLNYSELKATVNGIIGQFQIIIKRPKAISKQFRNGIDSALQVLNTKLEKFKTNYINGTLLLVGGSNMASANGGSIVDAIEFVGSIYKSIKGIVDTDRQKVASDFEKKCKIIDWSEL